MRIVYTITLTTFCFWTVEQKHGFSQQQEDVYKTKNRNPFHMQEFTQHAATSRFHWGFFDYLGVFVN